MELHQQDMLHCALGFVLPKEGEFRIPLVAPERQDTQSTINTHQRIRKSKSPSTSWLLVSRR